MNMIVVSGFLGSGKTTFIIQLAEAAVKKNMKIAILVNEIGEIGIDDQFMRQLDMNVWEILGGCICCTMAGNVLDALTKLESEYGPDVVLTEPTGAADPQSLLRALDYYEKRESLNLYQIAVLDALRFDMLMEILLPLITSTIEIADLVCINKADAATDEELAYANKTVHEIKPDVMKATISLKNGLEASLLEDILSNVR